MPTFSTSRILPHSPDEVFAALADAERLARWWGPSGFRNEFSTFEFREGGRWIFVMIGPDGARHPNESAFTRIDPGKEVVIRHRSAPQFTLTIALAPADSGTHLTWTQAFDDPAVARAVQHIVIPANEQNLDRLTLVLADKPGS